MGRNFAKRFNSTDICGAMQWRGRIEIQRYIFLRRDLMAENLTELADVLNGQKKSINVTSCKIPGSD